MNKLESIIADNEETLKRQSRSFSVPILNMERRFKLPIMVQYNLCKTIDTIEDSTVLKSADKIELIEEVCRGLNNGRLSNEVQQQMLKITPEDEQYVFSNYASTIALFNTLSINEQQLSIKYLEEMASGMSVFLTKDVETPNDLNQYCYYVAGTVGVYLSELLHILGAEISDEEFQQMKQDGIHFGLFLQKLNIIRDYRSDSYTREKNFWPKEYFNKGVSLTHILDKMCQEAIINDIYPSIRYCQSVPPGYASFEYFIRYILKSGIKYMAMLRGNFMIFFMDKVKLSRTFTSNLYKDVSCQTRQSFLDEMMSEYHELKDIYRNFEF